MIQGCVLFYNDGPAMLERALLSLRGNVDTILAVDGQYREFPTIGDNKPWSTDGCLDVAMKYADAVIETKIPWYDQVTKRNAYLQHTSPENFYFVLDADEAFSGYLPKKLSGDVYDIDIVTHKSESHPLHGRGARFFRHFDGVSYGSRHAFIWVDNFIINRSEYALNKIERLTTCRIDHYPDTRPQWWLEADGEYIRRRDENTAQLPEMAQEENHARYDLIRLKFIGQYYNGYDPLLKEFVEVKNGQFAFVSIEKSSQLLRDYPHEWVPMGIVKKRATRPYTKIQTAPIGVF